MITVGPAQLANGVQGFAYLQTVSASPGGAYTYSVISGSLPPGLNLDPNTGVINGTPTTTGTYGFTIEATGSGACPGVQSYTIVIGSPAAMCQQHFDTVGAPSLPQGWSSLSFGSMAVWTTSTVNPNTPANAAFAAAPASAGYTELVTPTYLIGPGIGQMRFSNAFNLEDESPASPVGYDGLVLELSINGGPFQDIIAAGGSFATGGYNKTISTSFGSPIAGRMAWSGLSGGTAATPAYITTTVNLPLSAYGQSVQMKWVVATDAAGTVGGDAGARIDTIIGTACTTTAANVEITGRVLRPDGYGLRNAVVTMVDDLGVVRTARTSSFGYYRFDDVEIGRTYIVTVNARVYHFSPRVVQVFDNLYDLDFIADQ